MMKSLSRLVLGGLLAALVTVSPARSEALPDPQDPAVREAFKGDRQVAEVTLERAPSLRGCVERSIWRQFAIHDAYGCDIDHGL